MMIQRRTHFDLSEKLFKQLIYVISMRYSKCCNCRLGRKNPCAKHIDDGEMAHSPLFARIVILVRI